MINRIVDFPGATMIALTLACVTSAQAGDTVDLRPTSPAAIAPSPEQMHVAGKFAAPFVTLAGSPENAVALATALRTGSNATLTYTSTAMDGTTTITTVTIDPPTKPMGWGNVKHSLALAQFALNQAGIVNPTGAQLQAALVGGTITTADGSSVALAGVLRQRADGLGFGRIAHSYGTTMGAVNHGVKAPVTVVATTRDVPPIATTPTRDVVPARTIATLKAPVTASGSVVSPTRGVTTAAGSAAGTGQGTKGITTAAGATGGNHGRIVSAAGGAHGNGNAYGRGMVLASGGIVSASGSASNGVVTGAGGSRGVVTADPGHGAGSGKSHGKGKGGG